MYSVAYKAFASEVEMKGGFPERLHPKGDLKVDNECRGDSCMCGGSDCNKISRAFGELQDVRMGKFATSLDENGEFVNKHGTKKFFDIAKIQLAPSNERSMKELANSRVYVARWHYSVVFLRAIDAHKQKKKSHKMLLKIPRQTALRVGFTIDANQYTLGVDGAEKDWWYIAPNVTPKNVVPILGRLGKWPGTAWRNDSPLKRKRPPCDIGEELHLVEDMATHNLLLEDQLEATEALFQSETIENERLRLCVKEWESKQADASKLNVL